MFLLSIERVTVNGPVDVGVFRWRSKSKGS